MKNSTKYIAGLAVIVAVTSITALITLVMFKIIIIKININHEKEIITSKKIEEPKIVSENTKEDSVPLLTFEQYVELNKNQRQELERKCIGSSSPTCRLSSSADFKHFMEFSKSLCQMKNSSNAIYGGGSENCNDL